MMFEQHWDDDKEFTEENYVSCPKCGGFEIFIQTEAIHRSGDGFEGVQILDNSTYVALNSDSSWEAVGPEIFHCANIHCLHNWPVDRETYWEWVG